MAQIEGMSSGISEINRRGVVDEAFKGLWRREERCCDV
jgi:hypothetical protein